ncbi:DERL2 [Enterospora canceri]|uniref:Derlin n=1 Tax=Enterospora canceri TaxID=1081671 RepID=A0A1Y1S8P6_9MICR|nr:DERL2 [Enterospora canceri]
MLFFYRYSCMLEESLMYKSDYLWVLLWCHVFLAISALFTFIGNMGPALSCTITYLWTRRNPRALVQAYGFVTFQAFYIPFILPLFTMLNSGTVQIEELLGIVCGHITYFLRDCAPRLGFNPLKTPCFLHRIFNEKRTCCEKEEREPDIDQVRKMIEKRIEATKNVSQNVDEDKASEDYESEEFTDRTKLSPMMGMEQNEVAVEEVVVVAEDTKKELVDSKMEESEKSKLEDDESVSSKSEEENSNWSSNEINKEDADNNGEIDNKSDKVKQFDIESSDSIKELNIEEMKVTRTAVFTADSIKDAISGGIGRFNDTVEKMMKEKEVAQVEKEEESEIFSDSWNEKEIELYEERHTPSFLSTEESNKEENKKNVEEKEDVKEETRPDESSEEWGSG